MKTLEIDSVLTKAYHAAARLAAHEINSQFSRWNLARHDVNCHGGCLVIGEKPYYEYSKPHMLHRTIREAGEFIERLPMPVGRLVGTYL